MPADNGHTGATVLEHLIQSFEDAWQAGQHPEIDAHLPPDPGHRLAVLPELVHADLEYRLKSGEAARVEQYLERFPELTADADAVVGLLAAEYTLRRRAEPGLTLDDYRR